MNLKNFIARMGGTGAFITLLVIFSLVVYAAQSYRSDPGTTIPITDYDPPGYNVTNSGPNSYFVPTNTQAEFSAFRSSAPSLNNITVTPIPSNPDLTVSISLSVSVLNPFGDLDLQTQICNNSPYVSAPTDFVRVMLTTGPVSGTCPYPVGLAVGDWSYGPISPNTCVTLNTPMATIIGSSGSQAFGLNTAVAIADFDCGTTETDEFNNTNWTSPVPMSQYAVCLPVVNRSAGTIYYSGAQIFTRALNINPPGFCSDGFSLGVFKSCVKSGETIAASFSYPTITGTYTPVSGPPMVCTDGLN